VYALLGELLRHLLDLRHRLQARAAPSRPEVDEDGPAVWTERAGAAGPFLIVVLMVAAAMMLERALRQGGMSPTAFDQADTAVVVTADTVPTFSGPTALVADRWGEILYLETASGDRPGRFPDIDEMLSWVHFAEIQCPECPP